LTENDKFCGVIRYLYNICGTTTFSNFQQLSMTVASYMLLSREWETVFTALRYASAVYAVVVCPSVCPWLSHAGIVLKRLNVMETTPFDSPGIRVF